VARSIYQFKVVLPLAREVSGKRQREGSSMKVDTMMQKDVVTVTPDMSLAEAQRYMRQQRIRHIPVVSGMHLVGIVTDRDVRDALPSVATTLSKGEIAYKMDTTQVATCMTRDVITVSRDDSMVQAARILLDHKFGCLPVVDNQRLVGVVTETDCLRAFLSSSTA
jgi:acetoin utilization protein AcuB